MDEGQQGTTNFAILDSQKANAMKSKSGKHIFPKITRVEQAVSPRDKQGGLKMVHVGIGKG